MVPKKRQSKRKTTKLRTKIDKKVREHNRKVRKEAKLNPKRRSSIKKDPGIPNSFPFKAKLLEEIQQQQQLKAKSPKTIQDLADECQEKTQNYHIQSVDGQQQQADQDSESNKIKDEYDSSRRAFFRDFQQVISQSDVIVQVLDARDPLGCRDPSVERTVLQSGKRLVLLLNKIDLIPRENAQEWLKYLRQEFPTIPFRSSTQLQRENLSTSTSEGCCAGVSEVLSLLKNYCRTDSTSSLKLSITVGVVGMPSVGKSSFINSLKRQKACQVGANAGTTRSLQLVSLDRNIRLLDSPGIIWQTTTGSKRQLLRNATTTTTTSTSHEPEEIANAILSHCNYALLAKIYAIPEDAMILGETAANRSQELLVKIAQHLGMMKRGALLDLQAAAKRLACDWNSGKIPFYSTVPSVAERRAAFEEESQVVFGGQLAEPFQLMEQ